MFYSQARNLIRDDKYTYEIAHEQVQAIRLMGHEIDDEDDLVYFIENCRTFDDAYAHLRKLASKRVTEVSCSKSRLLYKMLKLNLVQNKSSNFQNITRHTCCQ